MRHHDQKEQTELKRWQEQALAAMEAGHPVSAFQPTVTPAQVHATISEALADCKTADDIRAVFKSELNDRR